MKEQFRQVHSLFLDNYDKPFPEAEKAFQQVNKDLKGVFADNPFLRINFLRTIKDQLLALAIKKREPISTCLRVQRRRLEYCRAEIYSKAAQLVVLADYAADCGDRESALSLLRKEHAQIKTIAKVCGSWMKSIANRVAELEKERNEVGRDDLPDACV